MASLTQRIKKLKEIEQIVKATGNGDANAYMHGMANGLILARAIMEDSGMPNYLIVSKYAGVGRDFDPTVAE